MKTGSGARGAGRVDGRHRHARRRAHRGVHHGHGCAARARGRQLARRWRVHRDAQGTRVLRTSRRVVTRSRRARCSCSPAESRPTRRRAAPRGNARSRQGGRSRRSRRMIERQGGNARVVDDRSLLPSVQGREQLPGARATASSRGWRAQPIGRAANRARRRTHARWTTPIDHAVGMIAAGEARRRASRAGSRCSSSITATAAGSRRRSRSAATRSSIGDEAPPPRPMILGDVR